MKVLRVLNAVFLALFLLSVVVQYNDPDPLRWVVVYGAAALACLLAFTRRFSRWLPAAVVVGSLIWLGLWLPRVLGQVSPSELFKEAGMATLGIEEGREAIGLFLIVLWMTVLFLRGPLLVRSTAPTQPNL